MLEDWLTSPSVSLLAVSTGKRCRGGAEGVDGAGRRGARCSGGEGAFCHHFLQWQPSKLPPLFYGDADGRALSGN